MLQEILYSASVAKAISDVDTSGRLKITNPYPSTPVVTSQALLGTYSIGTITTTDEALTVVQEFVSAEHIFDFEKTLTAFDLFANRTKNMSFAIAQAVDAYVLAQFNTQLAASTANFAVAGGFTAANVVSSIGTMLSKVAGYAQAYNGIYCVLADTDLPAFVSAQVANGFNTADAALNNGFLGKYMSVEFYVIRSAQLPANRRFFGVKNQVTFALPVEWHFEEKQVSGKTGWEIVTVGYVGVKAWTNTLNLSGIINVT